MMMMMMNMKEEKIHKNESTTKKSKGNTSDMSSVSSSFSVITNDLVIKRLQMFPVVMIISLYISLQLFVLHWPSPLL